METWQFVTLGFLVGMTVFLLNRVEALLRVQYKNKKAPFVGEFWSIDGLFEYARQHLPNCYDKLCLVRDSESWQARMTVSIIFEKNEPYIEDYIRALSIIAQGTDPREYIGSHSSKLHQLEGIMQGLIDPPEDAEGYGPEVLEKLMPLPKDYREKRENGIATGPEAGLNPD